MPAGRPTKYEPEYVQAVLEYAETCEEAIPTLEGFAALVGVDPDTVTAWQSSHPDFLGACKSMMGKQKRKLIHAGLHGDYNPAVTIFLLKNNHGMTDRLQQEVSGPNGGPINIGRASDDELDARIKKLIGNASPD